MTTAAGDGSDERLGTLLGGRWRLERKLGEGGMGAVYAAVHVRNGKRAAIKILHLASDRTGALFARFRREARISTILEGSGGVVEVFDDDVCDDGSPYIVMELLDGEDLDRRARRLGGTLPVAEVVAIADAVLLVLAEAHRRGVVHRDLKPANVFVTVDGRIKVLDFGIAALHAEAEEAALGAPLTLPSTPVMGSIGYMAPEQARGEWESLDGRSDLWALGATMFSLLGGRTVHAATSARKELVRTMLEEPVPLASIAPEIPAGLCRVVDRALAFDRERRWPDAAAMRAALLGLAIEDEAMAADPLGSTVEAPAHAAAPVHGSSTAAAPPRGVSAPYPRADGGRGAATLDRVPIAVRPRWRLALVGLAVVGALVAAAVLIRDGGAWTAVPPREAATGAARPAAADELAASTSRPESAGPALEVVTGDGPAHDDVPATPSATASASSSRVVGNSRGGPRAGAPMTPPARAPSIAPASAAPAAASAPPTSSATPGGGIDLDRRR